MYILEKVVVCIIHLLSSFHGDMWLSENEDPLAYCNSLQSKI